MTTGAYAGLRRSARADAAAGTADDNQDSAAPQGGADPDDKDSQMTTEEHEAALATAKAEAKAEGFAEANARTAKVLASDSYAGREPLAQALLANDKLSADEIVAALGTAEAKAAAPETTTAPEGDAEAAARAEMQAAIGETGNSNVDAGGGAAPGKPSASARILSAQAKATGRVAASKE